MLQNIHIKDLTPEEKRKWSLLRDQFRLLMSGDAGGISDLKGALPKFIIDTKHWFLPDDSIEGPNGEDAVLRWTNKEIADFYESELWGLIYAGVLVRIAQRKSENITAEDTRSNRFDFELIANDVLRMLKLSTSDSLTVVPEYARNILSTLSAQREDFFIDALQSREGNIISDNLQRSIRGLFFSHICAGYFYEIAAENEALRIKSLKS